MPSVTPHFIPPEGHLQHVTIKNKTPDCPVRKNRRLSVGLPHHLSRNINHSPPKGYFWVRNYDKARAPRASEYYAWEWRGAERRRVERPTGSNSQSSRGRTARVQASTASTFSRHESKWSRVTDPPNVAGRAHSTQKPMTAHLSKWNSINTFFAIWSF